MTLDTILVLERQFYCGGFFGSAKLAGRGMVDLCRQSKALPKWKRRAKNTGQKVK
jgi:hypothetical protein